MNHETLEQAINQWLRENEKGIAHEHESAIAIHAFKAGATWREQQAVSDVNQDTSDGYHTFRELYEHRRILTASLFNLDKSNCFKSWLHSDGTMFKDYFIVGVDTQLGPATYHYHKDYWEDFDCKELSLAPDWDGHTSKDAIERISLHFSLLKITLDKENSSAKLLAEKDAEIEELKKQASWYLSLSPADKKSFGDLIVQLNEAKELIKEMRETYDRIGHPMEFLNVGKFLHENADKIKALLGEE